MFASSETILRHISCINYAFLQESGKHPPFYLTHITGIFDEHLKNVVKREGINISPDVLWQAGCIVARR